MAVSARMRRRDRQRPIEILLRPFQEFARLEASGGLLLLVCTLIALVWANSPWAERYSQLWHSKLVIGGGPFTLEKDLLHWINDGLMAIFFLVVGIEIKREILIGELMSRRRAALPIVAAVGGMVVPAALYLAVNRGGAGTSGWGIPMATDIAFALGALTLLGRRVPLALKVFLIALAIVDDIGAVLVIAIFYTTDISWVALLIGGGFLAGLLAMNRAGVRRLWVYALLGLGLWLALLQSGIHGTVAGVLLAMAIPAVPFDTRQFLAQSRALLEEFEQAGNGDSRAPLNDDQRAALYALENTYVHSRSPMRRVEHALHPWVTYAIMPIFALANAGISLSGDLTAAVTHPVSIGVIVGLALGKQLGVTLFAWLAVRLGLASLPSGVTWRHVYGAGWLAGIGFTMSVFIATLAFSGTTLLPTAKVGVLVASMISGIIGGVWLLIATRGTRAAQQAAPAAHSDVPAQS